ncbi:ribosome biogenesis GTP-binding protein YsxC [Candidatus Gracilibacteria bacterium CG17_big_fil_post_rev_8_21_14_2_50_48_13]|nr:MAG: ribosome biogenesis GTP-binding protein YsxC [Candidatus Gracilibacteria bacterium CG17_big_fil_post_rev_8_21_14_2_50_48_13]
MHAITSAEFVKGVVDPEGLPRDTLPYIAFLGRSNVGKSSTLNMLTGNGSLARKSSRPGKTTEINMFRINKRVYFADLPGYGYAKQPEPLRLHIEDMIAWYIADRYITHLRLVMIIDLRVGATDLDKKMMADLLATHEAEQILVLANKADGLKQSELAKQLREVQTAFPGISVVPISARKGTGKKEALMAIFAGL